MSLKQEHKKKLNLTGSSAGTELSSEDASHLQLFLGDILSPTIWREDEHSYAKLPSQYLVAGRHKGSVGMDQTTCTGKDQELGSTGCFHHPSWLPSCSGVITSFLGTIIFSPCFFLSHVRFHHALGWHSLTLYKPPSGLLFQDTCLQRALCSGCVPGWC